MKLKNYLVLLLALCVSACGSGGSTGPTTPIGPDAFSIDYCRVVAVEGRMRVEWSANRVTTGEFRYGQTVYTQLLNIPVSADTQSVALTSYSFNTDYIYRLTVIDNDGNRLDCTGEFQTPDKLTPEPVLSHLRIEEITESSAKVTWQTDEPASTILHYGIGVTSDSIRVQTPVMDHEVVLNSLTASSIYAVRPEAVDEDGLRGVGNDSSFATAARLTIYIDPVQLPLGDTVLVAVHIESASDLAALQYTVNFPEGNVEIIGVREGSFYNNNDGFNFFRDIRNGDNHVTNAMTWVIEYDGDTRVGTNADGSGVVAFLELRGLEPGSAGAAFSADSSFGLDMFAHVRACSLRAGSIIVIP